MSNPKLDEIVVDEAFPYLRVAGADAAIAFYKQAFGAEELYRLSEPSGRVGHAEIRIGVATLMLSDEFPERGIVGPQRLGGTGIAMHLHVSNIDALVERAVAAGATLIRPLQDQFYGERTGMVRDPFGHEWLLGQEIEKVSAEEMQRRYTRLLQDGPS